MATLDFQKLLDYTNSLDSYASNKKTAALYIAGKAETMEVGVRMAEELIDSGAALKKLDEFIACSNE